MSPPLSTGDLVVGVDFSTGEDESAVVVAKLNGDIVDVLPMTLNLFRRLSTQPDRVVSFVAPAVDLALAEDEVAVVGEIRDASAEADAAAREILSPVTYVQELRIDADALSGEVVTPETMRAIDRALRNTAERFAEQAFSFAPREPDGMDILDAREQPERFDREYGRSMVADFVDVMERDRREALTQAAFRVGSANTVTGEALDRVAAVYGLARRNEPGGDPEADQELRQRVLARITEPPSSREPTMFEEAGASLGFRNLVLGTETLLPASYRGRRFLVGACSCDCCRGDTDPNEIVERTVDPQPLYADGYAPPSADRVAPEHATPLAPLPDWLKKVDKVLANEPEEPRTDTTWTAGSVQIPIYTNDGLRFASYVRNPGEPDADFRDRVLADVEQRRRTLRS